MLKDVEWGDLDVMIIDLPPGTGDAQLTLSQSVQLTGAIIVSTPQDIALIDARKGLRMFQKVNVPVLGIIENMSYFEAPDTGKKYFIFGDGGAKREAEKIGVDLLGQIPLDILIREKSDEGNPIYAFDKDHPQSKIYGDIAKKISSSPRAVGQAAKRNPLLILIPCHRVVAKNSLGGFLGKCGVRKKERLLRIEKIN